MVLYLKWQERGASLPLKSGFDSRRDHNGELVTRRGFPSISLTAGKTARRDLATGGYTRPRGDNAAGPSPAGLTRKMRERSVTAVGKN